MAKPSTPLPSPPSILSFDPSSIGVHPTENAFTDAHRRHVLLRGLNVSGDAKYPINNPLAGTPEFYDTTRVSYTGRPFKDVDEAGEWWGRLRLWGVGVVRMVVCWEALEPREMGVYDEEYINYLHAILTKAHEAGLLVFIDGHQDVWSRFTGGSGAPLWTFHVAGLDPTVFSETCSAALDPSGENGSSSLSTPSGRLWPTNYSKFGVATMFTLFFAGEVFAPHAVYVGPNTEFDGANIGHVLRTSYIRAYAHLMTRLKGLPNILGVDPMNEPHPGYIGLPSLYYFNENTDLHLGYMPNALQSMSLAAGVPTLVPYFSRTWPGPSSKTRNDLLNTSCVSVWLKGREDIWQSEGVYSIAADGASVVLGKHGKSYFHSNPKTGAKIDFERDFYVPFLRSFQSAITKVTDGKSQNWMFVEPVPNIGPPVWEDNGEVSTEKICYAPHWYDIRVLYEKALWYAISFDVLSLAGGSRNFLQHTYFGRKGLTANYAANFRRFLSHIAHFRPNRKKAPILIGETGIPFDVNRQSAYGTGDVHTQLVQLDSILHGMEKSNLNWTLWNFALGHATSESRASAGKVENETAASFQSGDGWNSEDFSVVSSDAYTTELPLPRASPSNVHVKGKPSDNGRPLDRAGQFGELYRGLRLAPALIRPYPVKTAGVITRSEFMLQDTQFWLEYVANAFTDGGAPSELETEVFMPLYHFGKRGAVVKIAVFGTDGETIYEGEWLVHPTSSREEWSFEGCLQWIWDRDAQGLTIMHSPNIAGCMVGMLVETIAEEEIPTQNVTGLVLLSLLGLLLSYLALVFFR